MTRAMAAAAVAALAWTAARAPRAWTAARAVRL
jgi:hypothetical protein